MTNREVRAPEEHEAERTVRGGGKARTAKAARDLSQGPKSTPAAARSVPVPWADLERAAKERFGIKRFRSAQREVLESVFARRDTLAIMPTGAGKSLTYQLPALFLPKAVVVVSPLIALMEDQQEKAEEAEIAVDKVDSTLTTREQRATDEHIVEGSSQLIYVTPERLEKREFLEELKRTGVSLFVVDEAHTVPQWGHDFRPAFLGLRYAREALGYPPLLALTATATPEVQAEILELLGAREANVLNAGSERTNLSLMVHATVTNEAKISRLTQMIANTDGSGIVYTASIKSANELHERFKEAGISVGRYHGKMPVRERERVQHAFMADEHKVMIATKAFGLGIDKPDIRFVYHFEFPESLETYYQEAGRAGRDGLPSTAVLLFRLEDKRIQSFFTRGRYPKEENLRAVLEAMGAAEEPLSAAEIAKISGVGQRRTEVVLYLLRETNAVERVRKGYVLPDKEPWTEERVTELLQQYRARAEADKGRLDEMMIYAETTLCRKQVIREYFGEERGAPCGNCDNCLNGAREQKEAVELHAAREQDGVTRIETMTGTIVTTAPETLPKAQTAMFAVDDAVEHKRFGRGVVKDVDGDTLLVRFPEVGSKKLKAGFVVKA